MGIRYGRTVAAQPGGETTKARPQIPTSVWWKLAGAGFAAVIAVLVLPHADSSGSVPSATALLLPALVAGLVLSATFFFVLRSDLRVEIGATVVGCVFLFLVAVVKFALAPRGLYEVNRERPLTDIFGDFGLGQAPWVALTVGFVFALYAGVWFLMYRIFKRRWLALKRTPEERRRRLVTGLITVVLGVAGAAATGVILLPLLVVGSAAEYLGFIFSSTLSLLIALALGAAAYCAGILLNSTAARAAAVSDASLLVNVFWVGLAFLALYHVLWIVYVLVLISIWPLRTVVPK